MPIFKKRLIILSDYGLDDAAALAYLLEYAERFNGIDVVCVAGNVPAPQSLANAQKLLLHYGKPLKNVRLIDTNGFPQEYAALPSIHGRDGMGDLFAAPDKICAVPYAEWVRSFADGTVILSLGPCTVTLDILKRVKPCELILMAGTVNATPNFNGMEFNQALDVQSYNASLKYPHKIATLDTCRAPQFNLAGHRFEGGGLLYKLINRANGLAEARHPDNSYIYDFITALYLIEPNIFGVRETRDPWGNSLNELYIKDGNFCLAKYVKELRI